MYHIFIIQSSIDGNLDCFYFLATMNRIAMNMNAHVWSLESFRCMPRISGSCGSSLSSRQADFHSAYTRIPFHQR